MRSCELPAWCDVRYHARKTLRQYWLTAMHCDGQTLRLVIIYWPREANKRTRLPRWRWRCGFIAKNARCWRRLDSNVCVCVCVINALNSCHRAVMSLPMLLLLLLTRRCQRVYIRYVLTFTLENRETSLFHTVLSPSTRNNDRQVI